MVSIRANYKNELKNRLLSVKDVSFELADSMRYDDVGDYYGHKIIAYDMKNDILNNAILVHEFIEYLLVKSAGIDPKMIDRFDTDFDSRKEFPQEYKLYCKFHQMASRVERQFIENLGLSWPDHEKFINAYPVRIAADRAIVEIHKAKPSKRKLAKLRKKVEAATK